MCRWGERALPRRARLRVALLTLISAAVLGAPAADGASGRPPGTPPPNRYAGPDGTSSMHAYDRGPARKPGQLSHGSGATPTFFGPRTGHEYVATTDNAVPREHLLVYRADTGALACRRPLFASGASGTENSPIGVGGSVYVASTYGYPYPAGADGASEPASAPIAGGLERVDLRAGGGCTTRWRSDVASAAVPRYSRAERVIYTVIRTDQRYDLARIAPGTGRVLSTQPLGVGPQADTLQMVGTILPDRTLLQGTITGYAVVRPG